MECFKIKKKKTKMKKVNKIEPTFSNFSIFPIFPNYISNIGDKLKDWDDFIECLDKKKNLKEKFLPNN